MIYIRMFITVLLGVFVLFPVHTIAATSTATAVRALISQSKYSRAHSLGENYKFHPRDGWQSTNATDLGYKYANSTAGHKRSDEDKRSPKKNLGLGGLIGGALSDVFKGLKGIGNPTTVKITWYTGHDLKNPSCWAQGKWAPTDESFACATTLHGWNDRPQCLKFLELCNGPKKCVFVRVVDSCAGCAPGSRHVDLTRAAFGQLADFDEGTLNVQLRAATEPDEWYEALWGPKHSH